jgi:hypothetical protein
MNQDQVQASAAIRSNSVESRARELWEQAGRPEGRYLEFWVAAEQEIQRQKSPAQINEESSNPAPDQLGKARATSAKMEQRSPRQERL